MNKPAYIAPEVEAQIDYTEPSQAEAQGVVKALASPFSLSEQEHRYAFGIVTGVPHEDLVFRLDLPLGTDIGMRQNVKAAIDYLKQKQMQHSTITIVQLNEMLMRAYHLAENSMEMVAAVRELGSLNDLYPAKKTLSATLTTTDAGSETGKQIRAHLSKMSDEQLMDMLGGEMKLEPEAIPAEFKEVDAGDEEAQTLPKGSKKG